ncbi:MAG: fimbrillin family protein [Bacteroidales bacterium]|nr:fimbrillin family protein [Bacteroidales bacterium]
MKKIIVIAAAVLALASCTKVQSKVEVSREISFQVANYLPTRAEAGAKYENGNFGTYAWFNAADEFMVNEEVGPDGGQWATVHHTFYWPKTGSVTFVSYSPFSGTNNTADSTPTVTKSGDTFRLAYGSAAAPVTVGDTDLMYADLVEANANRDLLTDDLLDGQDSRYTGVPTLFRHALAKVRFEIGVTRTQGGIAPDLTTWEVTVVNGNLSGIYGAGTLQMEWNGTEWVKPAGAVWSNASGSKNVALASNLKLTEQHQSLADLGYVLPQALDNQSISLNLHIRTVLPNGRSIEEDLTVERKLSEFSEEIVTWQMNKAILYRILVDPTEKGEPILFDPAVADWDSVTADSNWPI